MCLKRQFYIFLLLVSAFIVDSAKVKHRSTTGKQALKFLKSHRGIGNVRRNASSNTGLWPSVFNLATKAAISANATCGERGREEFCRMADNGKGRCGICDNFSPDPGKRHSINFAIDGTNRWWQSPSLYYGPEYEFVTITIDLKQVYQIAYVIVKSANSPRPGTWILERSIDDENYEPWQYFARSDKECLERFGISATKGKPHYFTDSEVICTSFYSRLTPMENGEIHTSLIHGRPGANETSPELLEFTKARYVRLRLMGLRGTQEPMPRWFTQDISKDKRLFYSIRDISIGGQCVCNGHAENCRHNVASGHPECECGHHTCGANCDRCCPMFNQRQWGPGSSRDARQCLPCNCHGHATSCHYDENVDKAGLSMDIHGDYQGGGVCDNCTDYTAGINCEQCMAGYFRPVGTSAEAKQPCLKCECDPAGSTGTCVQYGEQAGTCECRPGYIGERCDTCGPGYGGYPNCGSCPCDSKGVTEIGHCEGGCICKANVEGKYCDRCKPGYFGLRNDYVEGCIPCYCSGVTTLCESAIIKPQRIQSLKDWLITDLKITRVVKPNWNGQSVFSLGNYEFSGIKSLFWLAPEEYLGNKLEAYNSNFLFKVQWVVMRGDTSGEPTTGPNIILVGSNGMKIAHGNDVYTSSKMTFQIKLNEVDWYVIPNDVNDIAKESEYHRKTVTRHEFLNVLMNIKHILLRSTFHTDQLEALLEEAILNVGDDLQSYSSVEKCSCPSGYTGLSCESCSFGYVRIYANTSDNQLQGFCGKCDCNGHSETCNPDTGECFCQHNTIGEKCERCAPGFYGSPLRGTPVDCKKCACPLENEENNFSPSCQLDYFVERVEDEGNYVCTQCPKGYTGDHCEICDDGYYGNPMEIGNSCQPCDCNGGPCDGVTGQCLSCKGNTEGWKCERCKQEHYGDPSLRNCKACECDPIGSVSKQCDNITGQCMCKEKFTGRTCDQCEVGYGNVTALCTPCSCSPIGSKSEVCDTHSGMCDCQPGVEGFHCDACQNLHYGFSEGGCKPCNCDQDGSMFPTCSSTGVCVCKPHYTGNTCNTCEDGYWKDTNKDCVRCTCNEYGTLTNTYCHKESGRCYCKPGVMGDHCDTCLPLHYGTLQTGCKKCDPCEKDGHICDPENGKCVCPPLTEGESCQHCTDYSWGYEPGIGCKVCNCSQSGSSNLQCDLTHGRCTCKIGYEGEKCNRCTFGYYGYPDCRKCNCSLFGTLEGECQNGECRCDANGNCRCKENVHGKSCNICKASTFGLAKEKSKGCTPCFCFGRSDKCVDGSFNWDKIRTEKTIGDETIVVDINYWKLPNKFMGDLTTSYGGYLSVNVSQGYFQVDLEGNGVRLQSSSKNELQLIETNWRIASRNSRFPSSCQSSLTRDCFMVVLQNVTSFLIEASDRIHEVLLDKAKSDIPTYPSSHSVEKCECPKEYSGYSCQDPNEGYFRYFSNDPKDNWIDFVVGKAKPCECNGKSRFCDPDTGRCKNCSHHTTGAHCELCDVGYYRDNQGSCSPCLCPSADQNNAESCSPQRDSFICKCKKGYKGQFCDKCEEGYFDKDLLPNATVCEPCNCNPYGVLGGIESCDEFGLCQCKGGFKGKKCDECVNEREYIKDGICTPCDECTQLLFTQIDNLTLAVEETFNLFKEGLSPPWKTLTDTIRKHHILSDRFDKKKEAAENLLKNANIDQCAAKIDSMEDTLKKENEVAEQNEINTNTLHASSKELANEIGQLSKKLKKIIDNLINFGTKHVNLKDALKRARRILKQTQDMSKRFKEYEDQETFYFCSNITEKINSIYKPPSDLPKQLLNDLKRKLDDIADITASVENLCKIAGEKNLRNSERIKNLKEKIEKIKNDNDLVETTIKDIMSKINATNDLIHDLELVYEELKNISNLIDFKELEQRVKRQMESSDEIDELFLKALDHVQQLEKKINIYKSIFNFTKDEWKKINASGAYEGLINGIREAKQDVDKSRQILEEATRIIAPEDSDDLSDQANLAHAYSDRLKQRINNLKDISKSLNLVKNKLDNLKYSILENGNTNNNLNQYLHKMESEITSQSDRVLKLEEAIVNSTNISDEMKQLEKKVNDIQFTSQYDFFTKYQNYLNLTSKEEIDKLKTQLDNSRKQLEGLDVTSTYFDAVKKYNNENTNKDLQTIQEKIERLRNKIRFAKQAADTINVAMNLTNCGMIYKLSQTEIFQSLLVTFKCKNCNLFEWSNKEGQSLSLKVENFKPVLTIEDKRITIDNTEDKERTILVQKLGSLIKMQLDILEKSQKVSSSYYIIDSDDDIKIGNREQPIKEDAYVYQVTLNGRNFGLWKFSQTEGYCTGQKRDTADKQTENGNTYFNGNGYQIYGRNAKLKPSKLTLVFDFSTFDENSLIYLAQEDSDNCAYIALFLENGYLKFKVRHTNGVNTELALDNKYNDGTKYQAEITMEYDTKSEMQFYILFAKNDLKQDRKKSSNTLTKKNVFRIKQTSHYIGGVPPTFNKTCIPVNTGSFLGFLQQSSQLTNESISFGVIKTNKDILEFYQAWINKNGYLHIKLMKESINTISFILRPIQPSGLIMDLTQYMIYLKNYKIVIDGDGETYSSDIILSKNEYHSIQMSVKHGNLVINEKEYKVQFPSKINIQNRIIRIGDEKNGYNGGLGNILINNKELLFNSTTVGEFSNVEIGREPPLAKINGKKLKSLSTNITNSMQNTEGCASFANYVTDPDAIKFGDKPNSYTHIRSRFWRSDFQITFKFRTFYSNGVIFISTSSHKQQHYHFLELREGKLNYNIKGRKKTVPILFDNKVNDGRWHNVRISKKRRKLTVTLDGEQTKPYRIPKTVVRDEIYLGGVPLNSDYLNIKDLKEKLHPFRGCMKSLVINDEHKFLLKNNKQVTHSNIRQCFPNIEQGAYFGGDAYAIYKESFHVSKILELSFEFRTAEQNGILLSVSNLRSSPALSVELQNGAVVMAVDMGNGIISNVTNNLNSDFALCNNMWHNVTAMYSNLELTVNVDGIQKIWVQSDVTSLMDEIDAPLYIGGLPDTAPVGTLKSRENFKGCIRKLKIEDRLMDWTDMKDLNNVLLNSCPVQPNKKDNVDEVSYALMP